MRIVLGAAGIALGLFGVFRLLTEIPGYDLFVLAGWLVGALVIHDGVLSPLVVAVGATLERVPARGRRYVQFALIAGGLITVIAVPLIFREDTQPRSKAILQQNYAANLGLLLGIVAVLSLIAYAVRVARDNSSQRHNATKSRPPADQDSPVA